MKRFRRLSLATSIATLALIAIGGLVRATGSGLGCPDWPRCHGRWVPPLETTALIEYSHRLAASVAIVLIGLQAAYAVARFRRARTILWPAVASLGMVFAQAALGAAVVGRELDPTLVTAHFGLAMALVATVVVTTVNAYRAVRATPADLPDPGVMRLAAWSAMGTVALLLAGAYVRGDGAGLAFPDWPLMNGSLLPATSEAEVVHFVHRLLALGVGILLGWLLVRVRRVERDPAVRRLAGAAAAVFAAQILVGAAQVWTGLSAWARALHVALSSLIWAALVALLAAGRLPAAARAPRRAARKSSPAPLPVAGGADPILRPAAGATAGGAALPVPAPLPLRARRERSRTSDVLRAYVQLAKPRIIVLLLVTTVPAMILAAGALPPLGLVAATLAGGTLAAASANAFNMYLDRDIDSLMTRTRRRPLPAHRIEPADALRFAVMLAGVSFAFLALAVNLLAALLSLAAILFYVFVYTIGLKRSTPQNIVIGGAAGAVPVLVGWAAVTGTVGAPAWVMFGVVFLWTPPHFWALALRYSKDYAAAGVPMMPVVRGVRKTTRQIVVYAALTVGATLALWPVGGLGPIYGGAAAALGAGFVFQSLRLHLGSAGRDAWGLFKYSVLYLAFVFGAIAADRLILA